MAAGCGLYLQALMEGLFAILGSSGAGGLVARQDDHVAIVVLESPELNQLMLEKEWQLRFTAGLSIGPSTHWRTLSIGCGICSWAAMS
jgi:hypothetical protein